MVPFRIDYSLITFCAETCYIIIQSLIDRSPQKHVLCELIEICSRFTKWEEKRQRGCQGLLIVSNLHFIEENMNVLSAKKV